MTLARASAKETIWFPAQKPSLGSEENETACKSCLYFVGVCGRNIPKVVFSSICTEKNSFPGLW